MLVSGDPEIERVVGWEIGKVGDAAPHRRDRQKVGKLDQRLERRRIAAGLLGDDDRVFGREQKVCDFSTSPACGSTLGANGTSRSFSGGVQSCSMCSSATLRYIGPLGVRCAISPARITCSWSVKGLVTGRACLVMFSTKRSMPPTLKPPYHCCSIGSAGSSPSVLDSPDITIIGTSDCSAPCTPIEPCRRPTPACTRTACGRPVISV